MASAPDAFFPEVRSATAEPVFGMEGLDARARDLLPIPLGAGLDTLLLGASAAGLSQSQRRRARRRRGQEGWLIEGLEALNDLGGGGAAVADDAPLTAAQSAAVRRLARVYGDLGAPPPGLDPLGAWTALQGNRSGYTEDVAGVARATFQRGAVSLRQGNAGEVAVEDVLPEPLQKLLGGASGFLRSSAAAAEALAAVGVARAMDVKLARRGHDYGEFIGQLCDKGIVEPCSECAECVGLFILRSKEDGSLEADHGHSQVQLLF